MRNTAIKPNIGTNSASSGKEEKIDLYEDSAEEDILGKNGANPSYWYSDHDANLLLADIRKKLRYYTQSNVAESDAYPPHRESVERVFISNFYKFSTFSDSFADDINALLGVNTLSRNNAQWKNMPVLMIIPIIGGRNWYALRIEIDYSKSKPKVNILCDDPLGANSFSPILLPDIKKSISSGLNLLFRHHLKKNNFKLSLKKITYQYKLLDQYGENENGSDCGPIIISNIKDYVNVAKTNNQFGSADSALFSVNSANESNHLEIIKNLRLVHAEVYNRMLNCMPEAPSLQIAENQNKKRKPDDLESEQLSKRQKTSSTAKTIASSVTIAPQASFYSPNNNLIAQNPALADYDLEVEETFVKKGK